MAQKVVKLIAWAVRVLIAVFPWLSATHRARISIRSKCPWCGAVRAHKIAARYQTKDFAVVHTCAVCGGMWAVKAFDSETLKKAFREPTEEEAYKRDVGGVIDGKSIETTRG